MELENDYIEEVIKAEEQNKANNYSLNLLSYRARSEKEIRDKMRQKGYEDNIIENTIEFLNKYEYIDDYQFGLQLARDKQHLKSAGANLIRQELYKKGVDREIVDSVLEVVIDSDDEYDRALELAEKKANTTYKNDEKNARYRKLSSFLARKGYSFDIIGKILKEVL